VTNNHPENALFDDDGLLRDPATWSEALAGSIAGSVGIGPLSLDHWKVIRALRAHYAKSGSAPAMYLVCRDAGIERGRINELFGYCLNAWKISGLPNPGEEAKSYLSDM
jgi:tRNA 2-thiouridine synthesizing protein E